MPVEAQACGKPVIALGKGGPWKPSFQSMALDRRGFHIAAPPESFLRDLGRCALRCGCGAPAHATAFDPAAIRQHALHFDRPEFKARITTYLADKMGITIA